MANGSKARLGPQRTDAKRSHHAEYMRAYRRKNQKAFRKYIREYMAEYRRTKLAAMNRQRRERHKAHPEHRLLQHAKLRAKKFGLPFNLTLADISVPNRCPALGIPLAVNSGCGPGDNSPTVDRIIPAKGYVRGNVIVVSFLANRIKSNSTIEQLSRVAEFYRKLMKGNRI